jgi:hypothetical protein
LVIWGGIGICEHKMRKVALTLFPSPKNKYSISIFLATEIPKLLKISSVAFGNFKGYTFLRELVHIT